MCMYVKWGQNRLFIDGLSNSRAAQGQWGLFLNGVDPPLEVS